MVWLVGKLTFELTHRHVFMYIHTCTSTEDTTICRWTKFSLSVVLQPTCTNKQKKVSWIISGRPLTKRMLHLCLPS